MACYMACQMMNWYALPAHALLWPFPAFPCRCILQDRRKCRLSSAPRNDKEGVNEIKQEVIAGMILCAMGLAMLLIFIRRMAESCGKASPAQALNLPAMWKTSAVIYPSLPGKKN